MYTGQLTYECIQLYLYPYGVFWNPQRLALKNHRRPPHLSPHGLYAGCRGVSSRLGCRHCHVNLSVSQLAKFQIGRKEEHCFIVCRHLAAPYLHTWFSLKEEGNTFHSCYRTEYPKEHVAVSQRHIRCNVSFTAFLQGTRVSASPSSIPGWSCILKCEKHGFQ